MKVCFFLQRSFAALGDAMAFTLREEYGVEDFCGYVQRRHPYEYLLKEGLVKYSRLVLDEDIHKRYKDVTLDLAYLKELETKYGMPNLWPYLAVDRNLMYGQGIREYPFDSPPYSHEDMLRILQVTAQAIEGFLDSEKPDAVVFSVAGAVSSLLLFKMAEARGIKTHVIFPALFDSRFLFGSSYLRVSLPQELGSGFEEPATKSAESEAKAFIEGFRKAPKPYIDEFSPDRQAVSRTKQLGFLRPNRFFRSISAVGREFYGYWKDNNRDDFTNTPPLLFLYDRIRRKLRNLRGVKDLYDRPIAGEPFAFFPLQVEPEIALLVSAPNAIDQISIATTIAKSLPVGWKLYVKDHPQMAEFRPRAYYERLKKIPNIRLIDPSIKSFGLTKDAKLIATITGSVGFEACIFGKPVITFGEHFINDLSFVKHCRNLPDLPDLVRSHLASFSYNEKELVHYLAKLADGSVVIDLPDVWYRSETQEERKILMRPLAELLAARLGLTK